MTRTATPRQSTTGCTGFLHDRRRATSSHGGNVFGVISASYTDKGAHRRRPAADDDRPDPDPPEAPGGRERRHPVRHERRRPTPTAARGVAPRQPRRGRLDPAERSVQPVPDRLGHVPRARTPRRGRTAARRWRRSRSVRTRITGPIVATREPGLDGRHRRPGRARRSRSRWPGKHELFFVFRTVTGGATGGNLFNLNWVEFSGNGVTVQKTSTPGGAGGTVPATLSLSLGTPAAFGAFTPGVARTYNASTTANVISTAGDATLSVADPSSNATGPSGQRRVLAAAGAAGQGGERGRHRRRVRARSAARPARRRCSPTAARSVQRRRDDRRSSRRSAPTTRCDRRYSKTLTFTLSTTTP